MQHHARSLRTLCDMQRFDPSQISDDAQKDPDTRAILSPDTGPVVAIAGSVRAADASPAATRALEIRITTFKSLQCTLYISDEGETAEIPKAVDLKATRVRLDKQYADMIGTNGRSLLEGSKPALVFTTVYDGPDTLRGLTLATYALTIGINQLEHCALAVASNRFLRDCNDYPPWSTPAQLTWPKGHPLLTAKDPAGAKGVLTAALQAMKNAGGGEASHSRAEELIAQAQLEMSEHWQILHGSSHAGKP